MSHASLVVPAYNVESTLGETIRSLLAQTHSDFEIIVVDDGSSDRTPQVAQSFKDPRIQLVQQPNRGLAGARNTGIAHARGRYIGFCDADDLWRPTKLAAHVAHLEARPEVGISYSGSLLVDAEGRATGLAQRPRLRDVTAAHVFKRNPIGNGSAAVIRRAALDAIAYRPEGEQTRDWWFDETFRQSEDIECWMRMLLSTDWEIEGITGLLTRYRVAPGGLSSALNRQYVSWERMVEKLTPIAPTFMAQHVGAARAYQLRYLARRAVSAGDGPAALENMQGSIASSLRPFAEEPAKSMITLGAVCALAMFGTASIRFARRLVARRAA
ncbi:glucosyl transferase [Roseivivax halodurans JCM 10272]|uniref:Glucosyl transferase n=1 Tax=Roseivivax halodurans JCM 10272 TaxID=1449350 RepID=X7E5Q5_9RHOB|nr:glycosyltransferase family A protein [Roseivivax halodurans]ETX11205.1 glucosyl transferase [Roseivivax halodurans JCM 10272]